MKNLLLATFVAAAFAAPAFATPVHTVYGDPVGSNVIVLTGSAFSLPSSLGTVNYITLENFGLNTITSSDPGMADNNETFDYSADLVAHGTGAINGATFSGGDFNITVESRRNLVQTGTFAASINGATFTGTVGGSSITFEEMSGPDTGTATYSGSPLEVDTSFSLPFGYTANGGPFVSTPLDGSTAANPPATDTPEPATIALFGVAIAGMTAARRRARPAPEHGPQTAY